MSDFNRRLPPAGMEKLALCANEYPWFRDLLLRWLPAGAHSADPAVAHLRLAIRDNYMNFYRLGQSVARVSFSRSGAPQASVHHKYLKGDGEGQTYVKLKDGRLSANGKDRGLYEGIEQLDRWISAAGGSDSERGYSGAEKRFVDELVGQNSNIIDLEMGLPAIPPATSAVRMDIVALEETSNEWRLAFWEAKLMRDGRLKRDGQGEPEVMTQLRNYKTWMGQHGQLEKVARAYQNACRILVQLNDIAHSCGASYDLGRGIRTVGAVDAPVPLIDVEPRLIIEKLTETGSWQKHLDKLTNLAVPMQVVTSGGDLTLRHYA